VGFFWVENRTDQKVRSYHSESDWRRHFTGALASHHVDVVLDVGANSGQYATGLRQAGFAGHIISFEPLSSPFSRLTRSSSPDPHWECRQCALGDFDGTVTVNVAGNAGASSSILPMLRSHENVFPQANYVGTEEAAIRRLDSLKDEVLQQNETVFLKIDVQGFEKQVIAGGQSTIIDRCAGMEIELSFVALYEGGMLIQEALELVDSMGFALAGLAPGFVDVRNGRVLQADGIFFRSTR
jgi:FkbM family methyltransferase